MKQTGNPRQCEHSIASYVSFILASMKYGYARVAGAKQGAVIVKPAIRIDRCVQ